MELKNIKETKNIIENIVPGSIAEELEIEKGDILLSINETKVKDIIDYRYLISDDYVLLEIEKPNGDIWEYEIEKEYDEDLGIVFTNPLIDRAKSCRNKCVFCFIDQLPPNMRETLYFKDDDSRLSFLQGNFITLTNMNDDEIDRIIRYRLSPINISVHTTNPELRIKMLRNKNAGKIYEILERFHEARLDVNCQIVLVPGINDGEELDRTLTDLAKLYPTIESVAVVPVGMTRYRENLEDLTPYDGKTSGELLDYMKFKQQIFLRKLGTRFVFPSDEFFALSQRDTPDYEEYEGFPQLENGVGLMKSFEYEVERKLLTIERVIGLNRRYIIATGTLAYDFMDRLCNRVMEKIHGLDLKVVPIINNFFGHNITVSGLVTGIDLITQLKDIKSDTIIIPRSMMKSGEEIFLDDITLEEASRRLEREILVSDVGGREFVDLLISR